MSDPIFLFEGQDRALAQLMTGMDDGGRWVLLLGPEGVGKSTVLRRLRAELELTDADAAVCDGSSILGPDGLVARLRSQLHLAPRPAPRSLWGSRPLEDLLAHQRARRKPLVVLVDDAHLLPAPSLVSLAELATKPSATDPAVFVVLAGAPALEQPAHRAWSGVSSGRSAVTCRLAPLTAAEARQCVEWRIQSDTASDRGITPPSSPLRNDASTDAESEAAEHLRFEAAPQRPRWGPVRVEPADTPDDQPALDQPPSGRRWRRAGLLAGAALLAGLLVYFGPSLVDFGRSLVRSSLEWVAGGPEGPRSAPQSDSLAPARQDEPRRAPTSRSIAPGQPGVQRVATLDRARPTAPTPPPARAPGPAPAPPSARQAAALLAAARDGQVADLRQLLGSGVPVNVRDASGSSSLMLAVINGHLEAARILLDGGAGVNAKNRGGITPVMLAVINEHPEVLKLLLERGADVNAQSGTGWTALTFAAWKGDPGLARLLLDHGANATARDKQQWKPLDYAGWKTRSPSRSPEPAETGPAAPDDPARDRTSRAAAPAEPGEAR
ncbi:MAG TPA: ankyrin repeat domain-containing protein [Methylomirabilota bacterium]|nr:ankyrin repeat domain-containing protein [Methylomirabilota bacterium]